VPSVRQIRGRIRSVKNTARVTSAMQLVAASKMRRAQERVTGARPYADKLRVVLAGLVGGSGGDQESVHPLMLRRPVNNVLMVEISPDRGLAGGLPGNINRAAGQFLLQTTVSAKVITVGKKARDFMARAGRDLHAAFTDMGDRPSLADTLPIVQMVQDMYTREEVDEVHLAYTKYVNTLVQEPVITQLLPVDPAEFASEEGSTDYIYEPDPGMVLNALLPRFLEVQVYQALLESIASEQSARMVAMQNATKSANEMADGLTLELNKARQDAITSELLDLVGGVAALEG
jgi:F-type H+-transporting ATPase subunit gamma